MTLERVTADNLAYAVEIQSELFPGESGRANFEDSLAPGAGYAYFLLREGGACVGIIGLYTYPEDPDSAWLGWFGIREGYRRQGLGARALGLFEDMAARRGFTFARLYTDAEDNGAAVAFYRARGYVSEPYDNPADPAALIYKTLIFSKSLTGAPLTPWNSRSIHLTEQIARQRRYG